VKANFAERWSRGISYIEVIFSIAIISICTLIAALSLNQSRETERKISLQSRVMAAMISQGDLIRTVRGDALASGRHDFLYETFLLVEIPGSDGYYIVTPFEEEGLVKVRMVVTWKDKGLKKKKEVSFLARR